MREPKIVAEIGCNHMGDMSIAKEMINVAKTFCKVDMVKFQKRNPKESLTDKEFNSPHPVPFHSYGETYGEHRENLEFGLDSHKELKEFCDANEVDYSTSVWDVTSAIEIAKLNPSMVKIPSACNTFYDLISTCCDNFSGQIHISFGMTSHKEEEQILGWLNAKGRAKDCVIYSCTSGYPVADEDVCLLEIERLSKSYKSMVSSIGFSGHHQGIALDVAAFTLGADWIERHYTLDRTFKGTDHAASLEPEGLRRLNRDLCATARALQFKSTEILDVESVQRKKLKWSERFTS
jgi:sialic acid synthase